MLKHGSLFSGIGGFDIAAQWAGWTNVFHCEINPFGQKVLQYYWPESESFHDIKKSDFKKYEGRIDIITGGFPCQPFSAAGKRKGADDDRYLWPEMLRVIDEVKPRWVVGENVAGLISMVQPGDEVTVESGRTLFDEDYTETVLRNEYVIETVCKDLEHIGYTVQPVVIPACATGAPHKRERVWFIAYRANTRIEILRPERENTIFTNSTIANSDHNGQHGSKNGQSDNKGNDNNKTGTNSIKQPSGCCSQANDANTIDTRLQGNERTGTHGERGRAQTFRPIAQQIEVPTWDRWPTQSPVCSGDDGLSSRLVGITVSKHRIESIKAAGNAIVPQVAYEIFKAINEVELNKTPF